MSADNWSICPQCIQDARDKSAEEYRRVAAMYGQVSVEEFDKARAELVAVDEEAHRTFREDYEFYGAEEGEVVGVYSGACQKCGLSTKLRLTKRFWPTKVTS